jgi:hypothetical protein
MIEKKTNVRFQMVILRMPLLIGSTGAAGALSAPSSHVSQRITFDQEIR